LVKVGAAALNRADLATARGIPHGSHGGIRAPVGIEWAGEVVETGAEVVPATASCVQAPAATRNMR
jgi:NADPH2:quinone reductase